MVFSEKPLDDELLAQVGGGRAMYGYIEHTVTTGQTLATIAHTYHVTEQELLHLNGLQSSAALYAGQIIKVPVHIRC